MPWSALFTRRKQSIIILAQTQNQLLMIDDDAAISIVFIFDPGDLLAQTGTLTTADGSMSTVCGA